MRRVRGDDNDGSETGLAAMDEKDAQLQALWEDLARKARGVHCPEHFVEPWRVYVIGTAPKLKLDISGCCPRSAGPSTR